MVLRCSSPSRNFFADYPRLRALAGPSDVRCERVRGAFGGSALSPSPPVLRPGGPGHQHRQHLGPGVHGRRLVVLLNKYARLTTLSVRARFPFIDMFCSRLCRFGVRCHVVVCCFPQSSRLKLFRTAFALNCTRYACNEFVPTSAPSRSFYTRLLLFTSPAQW